MNLLGFLVRHKELLAIVLVSTLIVGYVGILVLVDEQFEATSTIVPRGSDDMTNFSALLKGVKSLPFGIGSSSLESETDLYTTVVNSRTLQEKVVRQFNLLQVYDIDSTELGFMDLAIRRLRDNLTTRETLEGAFLVSVRAGTRELAAEMTNYVVQEMNAMIISLKVTRSRENREFLEQRVAEVRQQLARAEDSLQRYQERTGMLDAKEQLEGILTVHSKLESELTARELQKAILARRFEANSPEVQEVDLQIEEYRKKLQDLRARGSSGGTLLSLETLPKTAVGFLRWYREIEIDHLLLEFIVPLYEQAKIEEKKDYPILQVIDRATPPRKRVWPPRVLLALLGAISATFIVAFVLYARERALHDIDPELRRLMESLRTWSWPSRNRKA